MMRPRLLVWLWLVLFVFCPLCVWAGGPLVVGGPSVGNRPAFGVDGQPFTWDPAKMPIQYRVDPGPMAVTAGGTVVVSNAAGLQRVQAMFGVWQAVPTAAISFNNAGSLLPVGSYTGGDLSTVQQYNDVLGSCKSGTQSPVIFDADGQLMSALGMSSSVIGFSGGCALDTTNGHLVSAMVVMNGIFQDGVISGSNHELPANVFDEAITHEIGHFSGLDHSQINLDMLTRYQYPCDLDGLGGLPLMFPIAMCQARKDAGLPTLAPDDVAWISRLYPSAQYVNSYATISGTIFFSDGVSQVQGVNVIARMVDDPGTVEDESRRVAVSVVSGYLFTANPGQSVTASMSDAHENNTGGDLEGSRNPQLRGYYEISVPPGTYTIEVEPIYSSFTGGSSVGMFSPPLGLPGSPEFWNKDESAFDYLLQRDLITVHVGESITGIDIILNGSDDTFDYYEDSGALIDPALPFAIGSSEGVRA